MDADTRVREVPLDRREEAARRPGANGNGEEVRHRDISAGLYTC